MFHGIPPFRAITLHCEIFFRNLQKTLEQVIIVIYNITVCIQRQQKNNNFTPLNYTVTQNTFGSQGMSEIFSERLRIARERKSFSQTDLAKRTDLQPSAISHFENNRRSPSFDNLKQLADVLGVTVDYLLGRAEEPTTMNLDVEMLFRDFKQMSVPDREFLAKMAKELAEKSKGQKENKS